MRPAIALLLGAAMLGGCDLSMKQQAKAGAQSSPELWPGGPARQAPPAGTVAQGDVARAEALTTPPPLNEALVDRGEQRYDIYCTVCHGRTGDGDGAVVKRGFPAPPSFHISRLVAAPPAYIVDVITHGHGVMYSYADRVAPADRWAIAAYVKTLQRARQDEGGDAMTRFALPWLAVSIIGFVGILMLAPVAAATGWRLAFVTAGAPIVGAVLLLLIARVTGAHWPWFAPLAATAPVLLIGAIGIGVIQLAAPAPAHLGLWQRPIAVGIRAVLATGALAWVGIRLSRGATVTFAAVALAIYAVVSTAIGGDWLLGGAPGHAVSAIGMMLATQEIGAACAAVLLLGCGDERFRRDMGKLLVAAGLGLSYLIYMDFLILWYGDLPSRIGWYVDRATPLLDIVVGFALICGLFLPTAAQALIGGRVGQRIAGASALAGLALIDLWWLDAGLLALLAALCAGVMLAAGAALLVERRRAHG